MEKENRPRTAELEKAVEDLRALSERAFMGRNVVANIEITDASFKAELKLISGTGAWDKRDATGKTRVRDFRTPLDATEKPEPVTDDKKMEKSYECLVRDICAIVEKQNDYLPFARLEYSDKDAACDVRFCISAIGLEGSPRLTVNDRDELRMRMAEWKTDTEGIMKAQGVSAVNVDFGGLHWLDGVR
ncbi:Uncharacterised protein [uncultured archaeon]|nr:Uncharacterised protein [uncultured archaeon]